MDLASTYADLRASTLRLAAPLSAEDAQVQSMPDASPSKWHLAHTTWFFETFVLAEVGDEVDVDPAYRFLFNSYYQAVGPMHTRAARGLLSRPSLESVLRYRELVDAKMVARLEAGTLDAGLVERVILGLHHEQQHQELLLTDIKHAFSCNVLAPAYIEAALPSTPAEDLAWVPGPEGVVEVGHTGGGFSFDNEGPRHRVFLEPYELASRPVTNREFLDFVEDGGYARSDLWLSPAWAWIQTHRVRHPFYWREGASRWREFTLCGEQPLDLEAPATHLSYYEADAFARWAGVRLPTEFEWEAAAAPRADAGIERGNFVGGERWHPGGSVSPVEGLSRLFGDLWEWTASSYAPYPGYRPAPGAIGEYNGKFMVDQYVLRGGSVASARSHLRATYRNFFHAPDRWQFSGLRLARDIRG